MARKQEQATKKKKKKPSQSSFFRAQNLFFRAINFRFHSSLNVKRDKFSSRWRISRRLFSFRNAQRSAFMISFLKDYVAVQIWKNKKCNLTTIISDGSNTRQSLFRRLLLPVRLPKLQKKRKNKFFFNRNSQFQNRHRYVCINNLSGQKLSKNV